MKAWTQHDQMITPRVRRDGGLWAREVWQTAYPFSGRPLALNVRTYWYKTRRQARAGDISDRIGGRDGRVG